MNVRFDAPADGTRNTCMRVPIPTYLATLALGAPTDAPEPVDHQSLLGPGSFRRAPTAPTPRAMASRLPRLELHPRCVTRS